MRATSMRRRGAILVWFALMAIVLLGMVGLVIDAGILMAEHRHAYNAADAGALAAAVDLLYGRSPAQARATAITYVKTHHDMPDAPDPVVNIPPVNGPYAGATGYVEVIADHPVSTYFIHILPGVDQDQTVQTRAVAGIEMVTAGEGVITLNPNAEPGLRVTGGGSLVVEGRVVCNSEGGGVDENGNPVGNGTDAAKATNNSTVRATDIRVVGGVNDPDNFQNYDPADPSNVLHCEQLPYPDPLINLATPNVSNGVDATYRGEPQASDGSLELNDQNAEEPRLNYVETDPATGEETMVLYPGVYTSIKVTGGNVRFEPGIYVLKPERNTRSTLTITGGNVTAEGIMFYNTGDNYDPYTGWPDTTDGDNPPPAPDGAHFGDVVINAAMQFSPIDTDAYVYDPPIAEAFNGMLFYSRRRNTGTIQIEGNSEEGNLSGTLYAKWSDVSINGQGTYDAQFVVGSMKIDGQGEVTILYDGDRLGKAPQVFLVE